MAVFQESANQGCEVTIYRSRSAVEDATVLSGRDTQSTVPSLISCHIQNSLAAVASFGIVCKAPPGSTYFDTLEDDAWVDIVLTKNNLRWHVMRGIVDEVRCTRQAAGSGATTTTYMVSGRSFQKIFTDTSVFFNIGSGEGLGGLLVNQLGDVLYGGIDVVQGNLLRNILKFLADAKRGSWAMPKRMPNTEAAFHETFEYNTAGIRGLLPRVIGLVPFNIDNGQLWALVQQYADPMYTELWCDLAPAPNTPFDTDGTRGLGIGDTAMTVVARDKPFWQVSDALGGPYTGTNSPWLQLPLFTIDRQQIVTEELGRSGMERYNSFHSVDSLGQVSLGQNAQYLFGPKWAPSDMLVHGLRRLDVTSPYAFDSANIYGVTERQYTARRFYALVDWYCLNAQYLNGSLSLATGAPHVHIGSRLMVPGNTAANNMTFYVEGVAHTWQKAQGTRTALSVTRGYMGTDAAHLSRLRQAAATYIDAYAKQ
jgi:hypothetical protein